MTSRRDRDFLAGFRDVDATGDSARFADYLDAVTAMLRERKLALLEALQLGEGGSAIDVGCGVGDDCDPYAGDACVLWSLAIDAAIVAGDNTSAQSLMTAGLPYVPQARRGWWSQLIAQALRNRPAVYRMNGSAVGAFAAALSSVSHARSLPNGLQKAIQIGGDTDTVAAIAGSLLGAIYGASAVPDQWREAVWGWPGMKAADLEALALQAASSQTTP